MRGVILVVGLALGAFALYFGSILVSASGAFVKLDDKLVDRCTRLDIAPGTEDVTIDRDTDIAFVSTTDWRAGVAGETPVAPGGVFAFNIDDVTTLTRVSLDAPEDFQPHGISLWPGENGEKRLFVVNHPNAGGHAVEIFSVGEAGALTHLETISFDAMRSPNDVVAVGPRQFYATNDRGYDGGILGTLEAYLALPFASAVYFDGVEGRLIKDGLVYANGINRSLDGGTIYIAEMMKRRIGVYDRDPETGALTRRQFLKVKTQPDNIEVAKDGALWIAGHSKIFEFLKHAEDATAIAPSHVVRLNPRTGDALDVFIDTKGRINGASVGAVWDKTLIVGAVFDGHVMVCPMVEIFLSRGPETGS